MGCRLQGCTESDTTEATQQQQVAHLHWLAVVHTCFSYAALADQVSSPIGAGIAHCLSLLLLLSSCVD